MLHPEKVEKMFASFLITFRESLEAALIIIIILAYLKKIGKDELSRYLYFGAGAAILASLILAWVVQSVYGGLSGTAEKIFEGAAGLTAVIVLTYMIFWMSKHAHEIKEHLHKKVDVAISTGELVGISLTAFIAVFREGLETVLFLTAAFILDPSGTLIGAVAGIAAVIGISIIMMKKIYELNIKKFFQYTSILLIIFAAGLAGYATHEFIEAGFVKDTWLANEAFDINPPKNPDGTYPLLHEKGSVGSVLKSLVGYDGNPEWLRIFVYLAYWVVVGTYFIMSYKIRIL